MLILITALFLLLGIMFYLIAIYNALVKLKNQSEEAWSSIDVQLKRRYDLIPNLVEVVKGYAGHEKETLTKVIEARNMAMRNSSDIAKKAQNENFLSDTLKSLFALSENYPELKANENFSKLQGSLEEIEDNIQNSRRYYNAVVRDLNIKIEEFPSNIVAGMFKFSKKIYFEIEEKQKEAVTVKF